MPDPFELPAAVRSAVADPPTGTSGSTQAAGIRWRWTDWGDPDAPSALLLHGVGSSSATFWRLGPALAAVGWRAVAVDQAGHGGTGGWRGHHRFRDNAADVAAFIAAAGLRSRRGDPVVIGHSWGALTAAALPSVGLCPDRLVLIDPPAAPLATMRAMADDPGEAPYRDLGQARAAVLAANPDWDEREVLAKARAILAMDPAAVRSILVDNGDWDGGLADLTDPAAAGIPLAIVRGEPAHGSLTPDAYLDELRRRLGSVRIATIAGAGHSPLRDDPVATISVILAAMRD